MTHFIKTYKRKQVLPESGSRDSITHSKRKLEPIDDKVPTSLINFKKIAKDIKKLHRLPVAQLPQIPSHGMRSIPINVRSSLQQSSLTPRLELQKRSLERKPFFIKKILEKISN